MWSKKDRRWGKTRSETGVANWTVGRRMRRRRTPTTVMVVAVLARSPPTATLCERGPFLRVLVVVGEDERSRVRLLPPCPSTTCPRSLGPLRRVQTLRSGPRCFFARAHAEASDGSKRGEMNRAPPHLA